MRVIFDELTDDNRETYFKLAMSKYLGEKCVYCLREYTTLAELDDAVFAGYHPNRGKLAHQACFDKHNQQGEDCP